MVGNAIVRSESNILIVIDWLIVEYRLTQLVNHIIGIVLLDKLCIISTPQCIITTSVPL